MDGEQSAGEVTITQFQELHCNSALISVSGDEQRAIQDSDHSCCQIGTPSEIDLIAWTNLQSNDAICRRVPREDSGNQIRMGAGGLLVSQRETRLTS